MNSRTALSIVREMDRLIARFNKVNTALPKKKAKFFDEKIKLMVADRTMFVFNNGEELEQDYIKELTEKQNERNNARS